MDTLTGRKAAPLRPSNDPPGPDLNLYVGLRLRMLRRSRGMSMEALAEGLDVTRQQVQKYEAGANRVSAVTLFQIARLLDAPLNYFFEGLPEPAPVGRRDRDRGAEAPGARGGPSGDARSAERHG